MPQLQRTLGSQPTHSISKNAYANTTPFPNHLLSEVMPTLKDTEWRLLCVVVRQTLGWVDPNTGGRKVSDWMTQGQLIQKTGRNSEAISKALDSLIQQSLLQARNKAKKTLTTASQRRQVRGPIYYALHPLLLQRLRSEHGTVEEMKGDDFKSNAGNNEDKKRGADDEIENAKPVKSEYGEHSKTEYQHISKRKSEYQPSQQPKSEYRETFVNSIFESEDRRSEYPESRKANTTKENTKQTRPKNDFRGARSSEPCAPEINKNNCFEKQEVLPLLPERRLDGRLREESQENEESNNLSVAAREVVSAYEQSFKTQFLQKELAPLTSDIANQLERCCEKHGSQTLLILLPGFFERDYAFAVRNEYSLWSFLHSINVLLYGSKRFMSATNQLAKARKANSRRIDTNNLGGNAAASEDNWLLGDWLTGSSMLEEDHSFDWRELSQLAALTPAMRGFVALYHKNYAKRFPGKTPPLPFASALRRLHSLQSRYEESELARLLDVFFACSLAHIKAQKYSLEAFVHNVEIIEETNR